MTNHLYIATVLVKSAKRTKVRPYPKHIYIYIYKYIYIYISDEQLSPVFCLLSPADQITYDIIIRCSSSAGETLTTSVLVNVTSASRWQHLRCHDVNTTLSAEAVESLCFADGVNQFNIYENTISVLGRVSPPPLYTDMCPHYGEIVSEYTVVTGGKSAFLTHTGLPVANRR